MKKIMTIALLSVCFVIGTLATKAQNNNPNDNQLIGMAHSAVSQCLSDAHQQDRTIEACVETTGICFFQGFLKRVIFCSVPSCHDTPNQPCPRPFGPYVVATVDFACGANIIGSTCTGDMSTACPCN